MFLLGRLGRFLVQPFTLLEKHFLIFIHLGFLLPTEGEWDCAKTIPQWHYQTTKSVWYCSTVIPPHLECASSLFGMMVQKKKQQAKSTKDKVIGGFKQWMIKWNAGVILWKTYKNLTICPREFDSTLVTTSWSGARKVIP